MLVLTRKKEQKIHIGPHVTVTILRVKGGAVRIGIDAPPDVKILRGELSALPPSSRPSDAADTPPPDRAAEAAPRRASDRLRHASGSEATDCSDEAAAAADPPPGLTDPRRAATQRGPTQPGFPGGPGPSPATPVLRRSLAVLP